MEFIRIFYDREYVCRVLSKLEIFEDFSEDELKKVFNLHEILEFGKEEILHFQKENCEYMEIILEGEVRIQNIDENGNILTIESFFVGDIIGANLLFSKDSRYPMTIISAKKTFTLKLNKAEIIYLCHKRESFMIRLFEEISDKAVILSGKINDITNKTIRQRIMEYLNNERNIQNSSIILLKISKKELAEKLGVARSSLGRELKKMKEEGLVDYDPWTITIL